MFQPEAARLQISEQIVLDATALSALVDLLTLHASPKVKTPSHPEQTYAASHVRLRGQRDDSSRPTNDG